MDIYVLVSHQGEGEYRILDFIDVESKPSKGEIKRFLKKAKKQGAPDNAEIKHWTRFYRTKQEIKKGQ